MTVDRFAGFGFFKGVPRWEETDDEVFVPCHTDDLQQAILLQALMETAQAEIELQEMEDGLEFLEGLRKRPLFQDQDTEREIRMRTEAQIRAAEGKYCAHCHYRLGVELHEIVPRAMVRNKRAQREIFASVELCALSCRECHPGGRDELNLWWLQYKIGFYGRAAVEAALARVNTHLVHPIVLAEFGID